MKTRPDFYWCLISAALIALLLPTAGCGSGSATKAPVKGKVTFNGQPVTGGNIVFMPAAEVKATQATGEVGADGTFVLTTEHTGDGAAIGKHTVGFTAPYEEGKVSPLNNMVAKEPEVEVKAGQNEFTIELVPARPQGYGS